MHVGDLDRHAVRHVRLLLPPRGVALVPDRRTQAEGEHIGLVCLVTELAGHGEPFPPSHLALLSLLLPSLPLHPLPSPPLTSAGCG